jgi:hypothetical protein
MRNILAPGETAAAQDYAAPGFDLAGSEMMPATLPMISRFLERAIEQVGHVARDAGGELKPEYDFCHSPNVNGVSRVSAATAA